MDRRFVLAKVSFFLEPLIAFFALEWFFKLFKKFSPTLLSGIDRWIRIIYTDHDDGTMTLAFICLK